MKNKHFLFPVVFVSVFVINLLHSQFTLSGIHSVRYGEDKNGFFFSENLLDINAYWKNFGSWFEFEYSRPPEIGRSYNGLRKFRLNYSHGPIEIVFGDIYQIWGWGLILNQIDDQSIDMDNGTRGLLLSYSNDYSETKILTGLSKIWKLSNEVSDFNDRVPNYYTNHLTFGVDESVNWQGIDLGLTYFQSNETHFLGWMLNDSLNLTHRFHGIRSGYYYSFFDVYVEYYDKRTMLFDMFTQSDTLYSKGSGFYGNINLYFRDWSVTLEYKKTDQLRLSPDIRGNFVANYGGYTDFQNPPTAYKEQTSILLTRLTHQVDPNNERGYHIEMVGPILRDFLTFDFSYSAASRNQEWLIGFQDTLTYYNTIYNYQSLPGMAPTNALSSNPYEEYYGEFTASFMEHAVSLKIGFDKLWDVSDYNGYYGMLDSSLSFGGDILTKVENVTYRRAITIPTELSIVLSDDWSIEIQYDAQQLMAGEKTYYISDVFNTSTYKSDFLNENYNNIKYQNSRYFSMNINRSPSLGFVLSVDGSDIVKDPQYKNVLNPLEKYFDKYMDMNTKWLSMELLYNINSATQLRLFYGSIRGGLVCSNGICRYVQPFNDGFMFTLNSIF